LTAALLGARSCPEGPGNAAKQAPSAGETAPSARALATSSIARPLPRAPKPRPAASAESDSDTGWISRSAAWGSGPNDLGRDRPSEASPSGPMSFSVDGSGRMWVLDQVNGRIQR